MERIILHSDLNNFYASVECLYNPAIRNKPVVVGGNPELRHGIVLAKNYIAKSFGIATGEALWEARQKCKELIVVPPDYQKYLRFSRMAKDIYVDFSPQVEPFGLDECWLDMTGTEHLYESGEKIANEIRRRIKFEMGVTASVGVSYNKIFAKLGSDMKKPDATTVITKDNYKKVIWHLPVNDLLYVGRATFRKLKKIGIYTIGDLAQTDVEILRSILGKIGVMLWQFANGLDNSPVAENGASPPIKSIGNSTTDPRDLETDEDVKITMYILCESIAARLREAHFKCQTVQIYLRDNQLSSFERQAKIDFPVSSANTIFKTAYALYIANKTKRPLRSIGVRACNLISDNYMQFSILPEQVQLQRIDDMEVTIDWLRSRFGHFIIQRGVMLSDKKLSNLNPKGDHTIHPVSYLH